MYSFESIYRLFVQGDYVSVFLYEGIKCETIPFQLSFFVLYPTKIVSRRLNSTVCARRYNHEYISQTYRRAALLHVIWIGQGWADQKPRGRKYYGRLCDFSYIRLLAFTQYCTVCASPKLGRHFTSTSKRQRVPAHRQNESRLCMDRPTWHRPSTECP